MRRKRRWIAGLVSVVGSAASPLLGGCSPIQFVNARVRPDAFEVTRDAPYGESPRQRLDVYRPRGGAGQAPIVVFFYGGSWQRGVRADYTFVGDALASRGLVTVVADYRVWPEAGFPGFVEDGARALRWARDHAVEIGGDPDRLYVMGHSAGAHIAALLACDARYLETGGVPRDALRGMIGLAGPYDFLPFSSRVIRELMGPEAGWAQTQPINFIDGDEPPMLLLHGNLDTTVWPKNTRNMAERVRAAGGTVTCRVYPHLEHVALLGALSRPFRLVAPVLGAIDRFVAETSTPRTTSASGSREASTASR